MPLPSMVRRLLAFSVLLGLLSATRAEAQVPLSGNLSDATTGPLQSGVVYHAQTITVPAGATLTAQPGAIVKFMTGGRCIVNGRLDVQSTTTTPVVFTDVRDDAAGGDTNGDGGATSPAAGGWRQVEFRATSTGLVTGLDVRFGGGNSVGGAVRLFAGAQVVFERCSVRTSAGAGWDLSNAASGCTFVRCIAVGCAGDAFGRVPVGAIPGFSTPLAAGNGRNAIVVSSGGVGANVTLEPAQLPGGVLVYDGGNLIVDASATLTLRPGVVLKMDAGCQLDVRGRLVLDGTAANPVVVTDLRDDSIRGDTNGDGAASAPQRGGWRGITLAANTGPHSLRHAALRYAGGTSGRTLYAQDGTALQAVDCSIVEGAGSGVFLSEGARPTLTRLDVDGVDDFPIEGAHLEAVPGFLDCTARNTGYDAPNVLGGFGGSLVDEAVVVGPRNGIGGVLRLARAVVLDPVGHLTLEAGLVLKCTQGVNLRLDGPVDWNGTAAAPVVVTSEYDDAFGGDTNGDGAATTPAPGDWDAVALLDDTAGSVVRHARLHYGGQGNFGFSGALEVIDGDATIEDVEVASSIGHGLDLNGHDSDVFVRRCYFRNNSGSAITGVHWNTLDHFLDNHADGNAFDRMEVTSGTVTGAVSITTRNCIEGQLHVQAASAAAPVVPAGGALTVDRGVIFKMAPGRSLTFRGTFTTTGDPLGGLPVVFTDERDDSWGTDLNGDGNATRPMAGHWGGLTITSIAPDMTTLRGVLVRFGGNSNAPGVSVPITPPSSGVVYDLSDVRVEYCSDAGFRLRQMQPFLTELPAERLATFGNGVGMRWELANCVALRQCTFGDVIGIDGTFQVKLHNSIVAGSMQLPATGLGGPPCFSPSFDYSSLTTFSLPLNGPNMPLVPVPGAGQVALDPFNHLTDLANGDLTLAPGAPQIDAGDPWFQLDEPDGSRSDIGAYQTGQCTPQVACPQTAPLGGCPGRIDFRGRAELGATEGFDLILHEAPNATIALVVSGFASTSAPASTPYGDLCVSSPMRSLAITATTGNPLAGPCTATLEFDWNTYMQFWIPGVFAAGDVVAAQFWYRDQGATAGGRFSDAVVFPVCN